MSIFPKKEGAAPGQASAPLMNNKLYNCSIRDSDKISNMEAGQFLNLITEDEAVTFQTFDDRKDRRDGQLAHIFHGTLDQYFSQLMELNERGAGIFFTVNQTDLKGRETKNITKVRALFVDLDGAPLEPLNSSPVAPHIIIETSPKRFHVYWIVEEVPLEHFSLIQKALIKRFNADRSVHDLPRVMRLPGFFHRKNDPFMVRIIESLATRPYEFEYFLEKFQMNLEPSGLAKPQIGLSHDQILKELNNRGMVQRPVSNKPGAWEILCPWLPSHTTGDQGTIYFEPHTNGYAYSGFKCQHSHCQNKGISDLKKYLQLEEKSDFDWDNPIPLKEDLLPVAPFKEEMLPDVLRDWIMDCAERMQIPPDFLAASSVVVLGSVIGRKIGILPKAQDDWLVIPNLWGAVVGRPSLLKSPSIEEVLRPLEELIKEANQKYQDTLREYEQQQMWVEAQKGAQKEEMKKAARKRDSLKMPVIENLKTAPKPLLKRYKTEDATVEKIGEILCENLQGILVHRDELIGWLKNLEKYGREGDRAFFLESWSGTGSYTVDRIGRGTLHIPALCLSILGGIQPGPLSAYVNQALTGGGGDDGLLQRFQLLVWPDPSKTWKNVDKAPNATAREKAYSVFRQLAAFEPFEPSAEGVFKTCELHFTAEAQELFDNWRAGLEQKLCSGELAPALESHLGKYRSLMPGLALIFYLIEPLGKDQKPTAVDVDSAKRAIQWCGYLETHARRLYASGEDLGMESARALLERIKSGDLLEMFSPRDVYHGKHWSKLESAERVSSAIKILEDFGWIKTKTYQTAGRPSEKIIVHPQFGRN